MPRSASTTLSDLLQQLWDLKGTDLLITAGAPPWVRPSAPLRGAEGLAGPVADGLDRFGVRQHASGEYPCRRLASA